MDFQLCSVISPTATREVSDVLGPSSSTPPTSPSSRRPAREEPPLSDHAASCSFYICTPAKLSSLRWKPDGSDRVVGAGDYDGVVTEYDLERRVPVFERDEHDGRRVWSVDYSRWLPQLGGSASDDGTAQLWDSRCGGHRLLSFDPSGGPLVGMGCADRRAYVYDLRMTAAPVTVFRGHHRTVTYVRFTGGGKVVSAAPTGARAYEGHLNTRSFVGLSVWKSGGLLACGSETNQVFVYDVRWGEPIWVGGFDAAEEDGAGDSSAVSAGGRPAETPAPSSPALPTASCRFSAAGRNRGPSDLHFG
ncbi:unnamed protein product [Spirodela intermedia]|uniref:Uncharacterized protein n=1 Tax=Spirodela intermedia TaxID=51605 RepID=A0A7I8IEW0_SPIIN|nr:unnamed protein product [Spirodela intermedia]CAA6655633.1 unnamed protein product [Spirodela intermedia]